MSVMRDVLFLILAIGFFALAAAYVRLCAAVVGPEEAGDREPGGAAQLDEPAVRS